MLDCSAKEAATLWSLTRLEEGAVMVFADVKQRRGLLGLVVCALVLWVPLSVQAATYYVSPQGNDAWSGTSQSQPWRTIGRVNQTAASKKQRSHCCLEYALPVGVQA